jgi:Ca2+-binding EF-hand superfamily protein
MNKVRGFGRRIYDLYDKHPLLMNSFSGGLVYSMGEIIAQDLVKKNKGKGKENLDMVKVGEIGILGVLENGVLMSGWYTVLNKYVSSSNSTGIVLVKCLLDQIFFATQQDFLFLSLCAYNDSNLFEKALREVKNTFVNTWLYDCSVWPLVNFIGFSFVPFKLQPTYMACVQLGWQIFISSKASNNNKSSEISTEELIRIELLFNEIDTDNSGTLDANEIEVALKARGVICRKEDILLMIKEADSEGNNDGQIDFKEFTTIITNPSIAKNTYKLWMVQKELTLEENKKIEDLFYQIDVDKSGYLEANEISQALKARGIAFDEKELEIMIKEADTEEQDNKISISEFKTIITNPYLARSTSHLWEIVKQDIKLTKGAKGVVDRMNKLDHTKLNNDADTDLWILLMTFDQDRRDALKSAGIGISALTICCVIRKLVFKM